MIASAGEAVTLETPLHDGKLWEADGSVVFRGDGDPRTPESTLRRLTELDAQAIEADSYSLGGAVEKLEARFAEMLGKESAVFMPTGTLANHLAIRKLCGTRPKAVVQEQSHLYNDSGDCVTRLSGITLIPVAPGRPSFTVEELEEAVERSGDARVATPIGAVMVESPVRRQHGQVVSFDRMRQITDFCRERGFGSHLDGARLYMMSAATGVSPKEYAALFDTVYVSLYKYFGAPFGAVLAGTEEFAKDLYHERRMFGGGLSSAYLAAALALKGSEDFEARFVAAMGRATELLAGLDALEGITVERFRHGSNIFPAVLGPEVDTESFVVALRRRSVFVYSDDHEPSRVTLTVNPTILRRSTDELLEAFREALSEGR